MTGWESRHSSGGESTYSAVINTLAGTFYRSRIGTSSGTPRYPLPSACVHMLALPEFRRIDAKKLPNRIHERRWSEARNLYPQIRIPTLLIYGEQDWAPVAQRERTGGLIPGVVVRTVGDGGHFLSLDRPAELTDLIVRFGARTSAS